MGRPRVCDGPRCGGVQLQDWEERCIKCGPRRQPGGGRADALGQPLVDTADYYIQDARGYVGDFFSWWKPNGAGYTCDVDQAGVYKGADMRIGKRETDLAWPVASVQVGIVRVVDSERVVRAALRKEARRG